MFLPNLGGGGTERVALAILQELIDRGHAVDLILVNRRGELLPLVPAGVEIVDLGASKLREAVLPLVRYLRHRRPRSLHAMMWPLPLITVVARILAGVDTRIVGSEHTTLSARLNALQHRAVRALTRWAYLRLDAVIAVSAGVADDLAALIDIPRERITVIHNPLILPNTLPEAAAIAAAAARWRAGTKRILAVGALKPEKNYPLLLRAIARIREHMPASLVILGDGPLREVLEADVADLRLPDAVIFAGFETDPWPYYAAADLFVLSSDCEGLPTVLIEALHAGVPIVSTDCPSGPREILADGAHGRLVPLGEDDVMAAAIVEVLQGIAPVEKTLPQARASELSGKKPLSDHLKLLTG